MSGDPLREAVMPAALPRQPWRARAGCRDASPDMFFVPGEISRAKTVCAACAVAAQCLAYAESVPELYGVFGGLSEEERRARRLMGQARGIPVCGRKAHLKTPENTTPDGRCRACRQESRSRQAAA